jgi:hypothetical protein
MYAFLYVVNKLALALALEKKIVFITMIKAYQDLAFIIHRTNHILKHRKIGLFQKGKEKSHNVKTLLGQENITLRRQLVHVPSK